MKHVLTIQDISCVGRCSATVALPVLSAMGVQCSLLPTAVLSTHSGFPGYTCRDLTADFAPIARHWERQGITFDGLYTGYLANSVQAELIRSLLEHFRSSAELILVDPAMADDGRLYAGLSKDFPLAMQAVCAVADVIVPNLTEACLLTGVPYDPAPTEAKLQALLRALLAPGPKAAIITGVSGESTRLGFYGIDFNGDYFRYDLPRNSQNRHGTGDLFAAAVMGGLMRGDSLPKSSALAAKFVLRCLEASENVDRDPRLGVSFESVLPCLWQETP